VFFDVGKADLLRLRRPSRQSGDALAGLKTADPADIPGCCALRPHRRAADHRQFKSNWDLSPPRHRVVQYLISKGVSPQHLVAAGSANSNPLTLRKPKDAYKRNRRIEFS